MQKPGIIYYQSGQCPGAGCGLGRRGEVQPSRPTGSSIAVNSLPGGLRDPPGCTGDPVPVPSCSACSGRPVPHLSPDLKHSLTRTSPHLKRTRTPSCAFHSNSTSTRSLAAPAHIRRAWPGAHHINHQRRVRMARRHTGPAATSTRARPAPGPAGQFCITRGAGSSNALNRQCGTTGADTRASFVDSASRHPRHPKYKSHYKSRAHPIPNPNPHPLLSVFGPPRIRTTYVPGCSSN